MNAAPATPGLPARDTVAETVPPSASPTAHCADTPMPQLATTADDDLRQAVLERHVRRHSADWRAADEAALAEWLAAAPERQQAWNRWQAHWAALDGLPPEAVARLRATLPGAPAAAAPVPQRRRFLAPVLASAAALAVTAGTGWLGWRQWQAQPVYTQALRSARGQQLQASLPDGSTLRLDTATRLEVTFYRQRREVRLLEGQAVFEVTHDAAHPFHVLAGPMGVTVVGTRFAVRHTPDVPGADGVRVAVEQGRVRVARLLGDATDPAREAPGALTLGPGQGVWAAADGTLSPVTAESAGGFAPWRNSRVSFVDAPLGQALAELERYGDTGLTVRDPAVAALRLSGTFDPSDAQTLRRALAAALPVRLQPASGGDELVLAR